MALARALDCASEPLSTIDELAKELLDVIALHYLEGKSLTVSDAMAMTSIASPATIHRKIDDLREAGLIEQVFASNNRRTKYLVPTNTADEYFVELGKAMNKIVVTA